MLEMVGRRSSEPRHVVAPGDDLLHPVAIAAVAVLLVNDHVLKAAAPGFITGKLSDVAGLAFFPLLLVAIFEVIGCGRRGVRASPTVLALSVVLTGAVFTLVKVAPAATTAYEHGLGLIRLPFRATVELLSGSAVSGYRPVELVADPSDLLALPALLVPLAISLRRAALR